MRVALLSYSARAGDAIGNSVAAKAAFFQERGAEVRVFVESDAALHPDLRPCCQAVEPSRPGGPWWHFAANADLVVAEYGHYYSLLGVLPLLAGRRPRIVIDYHGVTPPELWGPHNREALARGLAERGLVWCADAVLVHSRFTERELRQECGLPADRSHRLGFPVDVPRGEAGPGGDALRQRLGLREASLLLFVGRLAPNKRVPLLAEAVGRLRDRTPPVHALIVGDTSDLYRDQADLCQERAAALGAADRLHFLGPLTGDALRAAYRAADVLVVPSLWESFCIPVAEAMACGLPVVASRAAALPETVGGAGLTFAPDDADDLARQIRRVLGDPPNQAAEYAARPRRVAVVAPRYADGIASGVERSLRTIAETLHGAGHAVEVLATCAGGEDGCRNDLAPGLTEVGGLPVHRFRVDSADRATLEAARAEIMQAGRPAGPEAERRFLAGLPHSSALLEALGSHVEHLDAVIVGPYLSGLTLAVARAFPDKTVLLPCFHDEPLARLAGWQTAYRDVAGILYHSPEEQAFAQADLGLNHPYAAVVGTVLPVAEPGPRGAAPTRIAGRYVVYCGRYLREKGVVTLLEYARRYSARRPGRFTFVFVGEGELTLPREPWALDLGFVPEAAKRALLAGADALVQLSLNESLSLVALEALAEGTPVLADARCAVLAGHIRRSGAGAAVAGFDDFAAALDDLWAHPANWRRRGQQGRDYVRSNYGTRAAFLARLETALADLARPLPEQMRRRGLERAREFAAPAWAAEFGRIIESILDALPRPHRPLVEVRRRSATRRVRPGTSAILVSVRVTNWGTHAAVAEGPGRTVLRCRVVDVRGQEVALPAEDAPLPGLLMPGRFRAGVVPVPVPEDPGVYRVDLWAEDLREADPAGAVPALAPSAACTSSFRLVVGAPDEGTDEACCGTLLETAESDLAEAERLQRLPDAYVDVTEGLLAPLKRRIKRKLLGNFKQAYVDVLSRQQSAFNRQVLSALQELTECCSALDHAIRVLHRRFSRPGVKPRGSRCAAAGPVSGRKGPAESPADRSG